MIKKQEFKTAVVYLTNNCNLSCPYCFVKKDKRKMSYKTGKAIIDFMLQQAKYIKKIYINFFGGEPLLEFELIKKLVKYGKEQEKLYNKKIGFSITTNGTLFTKEIIDFFRKNNIEVLFSFEGDKRRMTQVKGREAYNKDIWVIKELKKKGFRVTARVTIEPTDLRLVDFVKYILSLGFDSIALVPVAEAKWDQEKTDKAFMNIAKYYIEEARKGNILKLKDISKFLEVEHKIREPSPVPCDAGRGSVGITIDGLILPCHRLEAWLSNYVLGNVFNKKINEKKRAIFLNYKRTDFLGCDNCFAKSYCMGCCLANSYRYTKNIFQPLEGHCIWTKARVKAGKYIYKTLIIKGKNKYLIKRLEKTTVIIPIRSSINDLKKFRPSKNLNRLSFKLNKKDLNKKAGDKIISFLNNLEQKNINFEITKPLPRCLFGSDYGKIIKKFNIPKNFSNKKEKNFLDKCKNCIYKLRKQCYGLL